MATSAVNSSSSDNSSWSSETNWKIASGSLKKCVIFESSSDSPLDESAVSTRDSDGLVLKPPSSDAGPCEIKLCFLQNHEVRQIYVRSTAGVYEIYYAKSLQSGNEYLCTVRCSIAKRDEQVLQAINIKEFDEECMDQEKFTGEGNNFTYEDDWVEVKVLDSPPDKRISTLSYKKSANRGRDIQDFYEATAEINDSDPCTSVTVRLLSVQNKGCVCIDEIYVFADPVDSHDSENQALHTKGSAGNSLMAMLVPTLLQLSKSGIGQVREKKTSCDLQKKNLTDTRSKSTDLTEFGSEVQLDIKSSSDKPIVTVQDVDGTVEPTEIQLPDQILNGDKSDDAIVKNDSAFDRIGKVLEQLASRVSKIEEVCLRFEENMLRPINNMEMRIQRIEQQLEVLAKNSQHSVFPPCTRISAPSFPSDSNSSSYHIDGSDYQPCGDPELEIKELNSGNMLNQSHGTSNSVDTSNFLPSLVVTAPEFSCGEDEQDDATLQLQRDPRETLSLVVTAPEFSCGEDEQDDDTLQLQRDSREKLKRPLIDDVLAAALSGFLSTSIEYPSDSEQSPASGCDNIKVISNIKPSENVQTLPSETLDIADVTSSEEPPKCTQILTVKAPEFTSKENCGELHSNGAHFISAAFPEFDRRKIVNDNEVPLPSTQNEGSLVTSEKLGLSRASFSSSIASAVFAGPSNIIPDNVHTGVDNTEEQFSEGSFLARVDTSAADQAKYSLRTDICQTREESGQRGPSVFSPEKDVFEHFLQHQTNNGSSNVGTAGGDIDHAYVEGPHKDSLQNVSKYSSASSVDFGIPIFDVKFASHKNSSTPAPLSVLFGDVPDLNDEANPAWVTGADVCTENTNFIDIDYKYETTDPFDSIGLSLDLGICDVDVRSNEESSLNYDPCRASNNDSDASLI